MEVAPLQPIDYYQEYPKQPTRFHIEFRNALLVDDRENIFEVYPLSLDIR